MRITGCLICHTLWAHWHDDDHSDGGMGKLPNCHLIHEECALHVSTIPAPSQKAGFGLGRVWAGYGLCGPSLDGVWLCGPGLLGQGGLAFVRALFGGPGLGGPGLGGARLDGTGLGQGLCLAVEGFGRAGLDSRIPATHTRPNINMGVSTRR